MKKPVTVTCPTCGALVEWTAQNKFRPFCSERCRLIDLGQWAAEGYRIPDTGKRESENTDLDNEG
ncbi:DNA gyrase inhibitor YacG [Sulfuriferula plumbiphila]|uniref:DNA gyrase inhibitor YacG n=1 Tax=Sulfuriferula plumbiphila TaxID=171865 RepID=A0A512L5U5_9PROT|nr:DNA gyrase inhibitor YacG [Sulfuriferula plumbiphila]BBP03254.1 DNA gyrase inhibitor YacG [Sulfuriferula plumbiphila]GEP29541.1 DNA gyrase inhibitor YacG [Sulfuriferula plumbiphila]